MKRALPAVLAAALLAACQPSSSATLTTGPMSGPQINGAPAYNGPEAAAPAARYTAQALVGTAPLANAEVVIYDAIADQPLAGAPTGLKTDAQGHFALDLALAPGQVAYLYVGDGTQAVGGLLAGPGHALRFAGKVEVDAAHPLLLDLEATTAAGVALSSLKALGQAIAKQADKPAAAKLALRSKAVDAIAAKIGATAKTVADLAGSADIAKEIATQMKEADPRKAPKAAARALLAAGAASNPVLAAIIAAFARLDLSSPDRILAALHDGDEAVRAAVAEVLRDEPDAAGFLADLTTFLETAGEADLETLADEGKGQAWHYDGEPDGGTDGEEEPLGEDEDGSNDEDADDNQSQTGLTIVPGGVITPPPGAATIEGAP